jgi:alkylhydroperoxidase family enzyme
MFPLTRRIADPINESKERVMREQTSPTRFPLIDNISDIFDKLPPINLFRAAANAKSLYPAFIQYMYLLFKPMELDARIERLVILRVGQLSDCVYIWRQNVIVAKSLGITQEEIDTLEKGDTQAACFNEAQRVAFQFAEEVLCDIEVSDATYERTAKLFSIPAIAELLYVVGTYMLLARIARTGRVPLDDTPAAANSLK